MVFSISEFKSTMYTQESAKQDRFEVLINCPLFNSDNLRYVSLRLKSFSFPERSIRSQSDDNIYGIKRELPQGVLAPAALTAEFYCNVDMSEALLAIFVVFVDILPVFVVILEVFVLAEAVTVVMFVAFVATSASLVVTLADSVFNCVAVA